jgi:DNA-binding SARP family transcriptional activator/tetratricopeptide (TPR) repeat protein
LSRLTLSFLGCFHVCLDDRPVTDFKSDKVRALLAYLAVEADRPHRREALAGLLWPDRTDRDALSNLRYALASLRRTIDDHTAIPPFLLITPHTIQFNRASDFWLDVAEFERQIAGAAQRSSAIDLSPSAVGQLQSAISLYRGGFLAGFSVGDAAPFEEWALLRREQIGQQVMSALGDLSAYHEERGEYKAAQAYARQQVAQEPWNEEVHRALMRTLALDGQRSAALHQYRACRDLLRDELGVEPAEETVELYAAIRAGMLVDKETREQGNKETGKQADLDICQRTPSSLVYLSTHLLVSPTPPFVAREGQLAQLDASLQRALVGVGGVVFVAGEAGSGKTALLGEFARRTMKAHADLVVAGGNCNATAGIGDPYLPFREILQLLSGDIEAKRAGATLTPDHARRLWAVLPDTVSALMEAGPDLVDTFVPRASLILRAEAFAGGVARGAWQDRLSRLRQPPGGDARNQPSALQQTNLSEQVIRVLQLLARHHPLLLILDDLQWADAGSVSLLFHLGRRLAGSRILVVAAYRPDAIAPGPEDTRHPLAAVVNELQRVSGDRPIDLDQCEGRQFVEALLNVEPNRLSAGFRAQLVRHTEGHPLFTVELLRGLKEGGDLVRDAEGRWVEGPALHWDKLPARVEAVIAERIGRLPDRCRALLAAASVEGEEFTAEIIARVLGVEKSAILQCLSGDLGDRLRLVTAVSLQGLGARKLSRYRFRHHLFQQYLYDHLDAVRRAHLHEAVGSALVALGGETPGDLEALAPRLAWHFEAAGLAERAAYHYLQAGRRAARLAAHEDAITHLTHGLALLDGLPDSPERLQLKLDLCLAVISPYAFARSYLAPERTRALERAYELSQHPMLAGSPQRGFALASMAFFATWTAEPDRARQFGEQFLRMAERNPDPQQLQLAHLLLGVAWLWRGDFVPAHEHLKRALADYDFRCPHPMDLLFGIHVGVINLGWESFVLWQLGYPDQALQYLDRTLAAAQESDHRETQAFARTLAAMTSFVMAGDADAGRSQIEALWSLHVEKPALGAWVNSLAGWNTSGDGQSENSLEQARQAIATSGVMGSGFGRAAQLALLALGYAQAGQAEKGLGALDEALAWIETSGVRGFEAEVHRLKGELLLLRQSSQEEAAWSTTKATAEACFRHAIAVARRQEARWWELRATVSLCRLLKERHASLDTDPAEARQKLAEIYGWFTEGFDTVDLREARALLEEPGAM